MPQFRKRPIVVEANYWDGKRETAEMLVHWITRSGGEALFVNVPRLTCSISITTLEGEMYATPGDWIIKGVQGEFYPCKGDIFDETYEAV